MENALSRASLAVELLDGDDQEWFMGINTNTLDVSDTTKCILAQVYGDYWYGKQVLGIEEAMDFALDCFYDERDEINKMWVEIINMRKANAGV